MHITLNLIAVAFGGAVGALGRFGIAELLRVATSWPPAVSTLLSNVLGCFGIGLVFVIMDDADHPSWVQPLVVTGLLGAFTTFSTFSLDAMHLIHDRKLGAMALYVGVSVIVGLAAVKMGMWAAGRG